MLFPITLYFLEFNDKDRLVRQNKKKKSSMNFGEYLAHFFT